MVVDSSGCSHLYPDLWQVWLAAWWASRVMGEVCSSCWGESSSGTLAREHYLPDSADELFLSPKSELCSALADKLDTLFIFLLGWLDSIRFKRPICSSMQHKNCSGIWRLWLKIPEFDCLSYALSFGKFNLWYQEEVLNFIKARMIRWWVLL